MPGTGWNRLLVKFFRCSRSRSYTHMRLGPGARRCVWAGDIDLRLDSHCTWLGMFARLFFKRWFAERTAPLAVFFRLFNGLLCSFTRIGVSMEHRHKNSYRLAC